MGLGSWLASGAAIGRIATPVLGRRNRAAIIRGSATAVVLAALATASASASGAATGRAPPYGHLIAVSRLALRPAGGELRRVVPQLSGGAPPANQSSARPSLSWGTGASPSLRQSFEGIFDPSITPPDTNGAAGPTRQVEIVNSMLGIWDGGSSPALLAQISLATLTGSSGFLIDPRVTWDAQTRRFYYAVGDDTNNVLLTGFSTTSSPSSASDWCRYAIPQGNKIDQPHLGDSKNFILTGFFLFFSGPEVAWYAKPPPGPACPATLASGTEPVPSAGGYPPAPAHEIDATATGYVLSAQAQAGAGVLTLVRVTRDSATGNAVFSAPASIPIPAFSAAPPAAQEGASQLINVGDPRLGQVIGAVDPLRGHRFALWTDQTVAGGAGSAIRWFEVNASSNSLLQTGTVTSPTLWAFYGAISPDRLVNGKTARFGGSMVLTFDTSSSTSHPAIWITSKRGHDPQSTPLLVKQSHEPYLSFDCPSAGNVCHWGDYSGAAPDPIANPRAPRGVVWGASEWNVANPTPSSATAWRTWIFTASP
jgi:hypothetical protein